jgi:hypothetical protein
MSNGINPTFFNFISQVAHCAAMYAITFTLAVKYGWSAFLIAAAGVVVYGAVKEGWYDPKFENPITAGSGWLDFGCLCAGPTLAALAYWL